MCATPSPLPKTRILCLDTEPETAVALHQPNTIVETGEIGYRTGIPSLDVAPHEFDLIVCDLKKPAVFSMEDWGPFRGNDNGKFTPATPSGLTTYYVDRNGNRVPRLRIILPSQLEARGPSTFGVNDVFRAIERAGTPAIFILNPEWIRYVAYDSPNIFGVTWRFRSTSAERVRVEPILAETLPLIEGLIPIHRPIQYAIQGGPARYDRRTYSSQVLPAREIVVNAVGDVFGQVIPVGEGAIWAVPAFANNAGLLMHAVDRLHELRAISQVRGQATVHPAPPPEPPVEPITHDLFICHASEDKNAFVRPLVEALIAENVTVWFDEYEIRLGDRLRRRIEAGLRSSRHGVVILSHTFFKKEWPQDELDALAARADSGRKILPIWHEVTLEDIKRYSPLLAGVYAAKSSEGIPAVVREVLRVVRP